MGPTSTDPRAGRQQSAHDGITTTRLTTGGGTRPLWTRHGQELLYIATGGEVMGVAVPSGSSWGSTTPKLLAKGDYITNSLDPIRTYDVSADGQRFLLIKPDKSGQSNRAPAGLIVVLNWVEELERLAPLK